VTCQSRCRSRAKRTKLLPMNPAPPVTRTSTILAGPVVRQRVVRLQPELVRIAVAVGFRRHVDDQGRLGTDALPAVIDEIWNLHEHGILRTDEEFVDRPGR